MKIMKIYLDNKLKYINILDMSISLLVSIISAIIFFITYFLEHVFYNKLNIIKKNKYYNDINDKENFTPYINGIVRPHIRNVRRHAENFSDDTNSFFRKMIRKSGLYY